MTSAPPVPRRWLSPRFSLRVLLIAVTAFAIGFPIWHRWPYEEKQVTYAKNAAGQPDLSRPPVAWRVITWQRQWGGGRQQHGQERYYVGGKLVELETHRDGQLHGPFKRFSVREGAIRESGQYAFGRPTGTWREFDFSGRESTRSEFKEGQVWRISSTTPGGVERSIEFTPDIKPFKIVVGGVEIEDRLARLAGEGQIDDPRVKWGVGDATSVEFVETPLKDTIDFLSAQHQFPMMADEARLNVNQPLTDNWKGIPLSAALTLMTAPHDLACDYRYGHVWVASAKDVQNWRDPTGVADIVPPKDSQLARSWNEPVEVQAIEQPLADVVAGLAAPLDIDADVSQITSVKEGDPAHVVTFSVRGHPFQHVLGILLYKTGCRCRLDGETLVILPPEEGGLVLGTVYRVQSICARQDCTPRAERHRGRSLQRRPPTSDL